jgi:hypothetical protein
MEFPLFPSIEKVRDGQCLVTTEPVFVSEIRSYPAGTRVIVRAATRDIDAKGYVSGSWLWVELPDGTELGYPRTSLRRTFLIYCFICACNKRKGPGA